MHPRAQRTHTPGVILGFLLDIQKIFTFVKRWRAVKVRVLVHLQLITWRVCWGDIVGLERAIKVWGSSCTFNSYSAEAFGVGG